MVPTVPAFGGIPAGPELLIIFLILALFVVPAIAVAVIVLLVLKLRSDDTDGDPHDETDSVRSNADRIAALEAEIERLRRKVDEESGEESDERDSDGRR